ncbi:MAG TPA: DinB family protein [Candidatus Aquilonibacter sp.]|nr:DinB family protein [Candidatus Aquilonibacter sp.]
MSNDAIATNFLAYSARRMQTLHGEIATCLGKLTEEQIWQRGGPHENSVGNLLLHLEGNIRQWILHGIAGQPDVRRRDEEFTLTPSTDSKTAFDNFTATLNEARDVIATLPPARLTEVIDPQPTGIARHVPILEAIYRIVAHLAYHTGQIVVLTKQLAATDLDLSIPRKR